MSATVADQPHDPCAGATCAICDQAIGIGDGISGKDGMPLHKACAIRKTRHDPCLRPWHIRVAQWEDKEHYLVLYKFRHMDEWCYSYAGNFEGSQGGLGAVSDELAIELMESPSYTVGLGPLAAGPARDMKNRFPTVHRIV